MPDPYQSSGPASFPGAHAQSSQPLQNQSSEQLFSMTDNSAANAGFSYDSIGTSSVQTCSAAARKSETPCYVDNVVLKQTGTAAQVTWTLNAPRERDLPPKIKKLLGGDHLLMEVISEDRRSKAASVIPAEITVSSNYQGSCSLGKHMLVTLTDNGATDSPTTAKNATFTFDALCKPKPLLLTDPFERIWPFGKKGHISYRVAVESCAQHEKPQVGAVRRVVGRVEAYRKSSASISVSNPPKVHAKAGAKGDINIRRKDGKRGPTVTETSASVKVTGSTGDSASLEYKNDRKSGERSITEKKLERMPTNTEGVYYVKAKEIKHTTNSKTGENNTTTTSTFSKFEESLSANRGSVKAEFEEKDGTYQEEDEVDIGYMRPTKVDVIKNYDGEIKPTKFDPNEALLDAKETWTATIDGDSLDIVDTFGKILNFQKKVKKFVEDIYDTVPKVGWWAEVDFNMLAGTFKVSTNVVPGTVAHHDRVWLVKRDFKLNSDITLFSAKASIVVGFEVQVDNFVGPGKLVSLALTLEVGFILGAKLNGELTATSDINDLSNTTKGVVSAELFGEGKGEATALGFGISASARINVLLKGRLALDATMENGVEMWSDIVTDPPKAVIKFFFGATERYNQDFFLTGQKQPHVWTEADLIGTSRERARKAREELAKASADKKAGAR